MEQFLMLLNSMVLPNGIWQMQLFQINQSEDSSKNIPSGQSSAKLPVTQSLGHSVTRSPVILSSFHFNMLTNGQTTSGSTGLLRRQK